MKGVNLVAETGLGAWLARLRGGRTQREVAAAAQISERTVQRYESDQGPSYELLRLLDALGVRLKPSPPLEAPRAMNVELADLRVRLTELEGKVDEVIGLVTEALELQREARRRDHADAPGASR